MLMRLSGVYVEGGLRIWPFLDANSGDNIDYSSKIKYLKLL